jgi:hypothetical protein
MKIFCKLLLALVLMPQLTAATTFYRPSFGAPVVVGDKLVFGDDAFEAHRLICIDRKSGAKQWEIRDPRRVLKPWIERDADLIITSGPSLEKCDVRSGKLTRLYATDLEKIMSVTLHGAHVFVVGYRNDVDYLLGFDAKAWRKLWQLPRVHEIAAVGSNAVLGVETTRKLSDEPKFKQARAFQHVSNALVGISIGKGTVMWRRALGENEFYPEAAAVRDWFIVATGNNASCLSQASGRVFKEIPLADQPYASVSFAVRGEQLLMWLHFTLSELSVPNLQKRDLFYAGGYFAYSLHLHGDIVLPSTVHEKSAWQLTTGKKLWDYREQWFEGPVHDEFVYFSQMDDDGKSKSMNKVEVATGKIERLYYEELGPQD